MLGTNDPDLSKFKANGGKMITWHGLADEARLVMRISCYIYEATWRIHVYLYPVEASCIRTEAFRLRLCG